MEQSSENECHKLKSYHIYIIIKSCLNGFLRGFTEQACGTKWYILK